MSSRSLSLCLLAVLIPGWAAAQDTTVFKEVNGMVAVEAEHFFKQTEMDVRAFHLTTAETHPSVGADGDPPHVEGASNGAYLEILPDTRRTHGDKLIRGTNFSPQPGKMAVLHYKVHFQTPGRYYVWVRAHSTGSEDNGLHVGIDGTWPATGQRLQWCKGKRTWRWESKQRTEKEHCGEPYKIFLDIKEPGVHTIHFSMREDGFEFDKWLMTTQRQFKRPEDAGPAIAVHAGKAPATYKYIPVSVVTPQPAQQDNAGGSPTKAVSDQPLKQPRRDHGDGTITISGEAKQWHAVTLTLDGPFAHEQDNAPNPFTDYRMTVRFEHSDGTKLVVPGYFAADGNAGNTSAESGTKWRVHFEPNKIGTWTYTVQFRQGELAALNDRADAKPLADYDGKSGKIEISASDKQGRDLRAHGQLRYVGKHYLQFAGSQKYFLKAGADAPETLLGYADFDGTIAGNPKKSPLKTYTPHIKDWQAGDPTWQDGKGKGLIGAINYLSGKGCNVFSFLTYNAGGDGDNVWPFIHRDDKLHYDCSKLDQWAIVFDHGTRKGMYLHFKMQETEMDDHRQKGKDSVPESLDGGKLGVQRKLYCRELIARFAHNLALNWNLGEENTQSTAEQKAMLDYLAKLDAYDHNRVVHTFPNQQDQKYGPLLGDASKLTGVSLQNSNIADTHKHTLKWVQKSAATGKPWIVAFDESGTAAHGQCPDLGYAGYDGRDKTGEMTYTQHEVRKQTLWGTLMAGGAGVEYYFGYRYVENDLICEDWRSRDRSWDYCRIALQFFHDHEIPFWKMQNHNRLINNESNGNSKYCFAAAGDVYLVYLANGGTSRLDLSDAKGTFNVAWFNPRHGGSLQPGSVGKVNGGGVVDLGTAPSDQDQDWLVVIRK